MTVSVEPSEAFFDSEEWAVTIAIEAAKRTFWARYPIRGYEKYVFYNPCSIVPVQVKIAQDMLLRLFEYQIVVSVFRKTSDMDQREQREEFAQA